MVSFSSGEIYYSNCWFHLFSAGFVTLFCDGEYDGHDSDVSYKGLMFLTFLSPS